MRATLESLFLNHRDRDRLDEWCCRAALGDLSREEKIVFDEHLQRCQECRDSIKSFERVGFFDLPAVAVMRAEEGLPPDVALVNDRQLLAEVRHRADSSLLNRKSQSPLELISSSRTEWWTRVVWSTRKAIPKAGWALAAGLLLWMIPHQSSRVPDTHAVVSPQPSLDKPNSLEQLQNSVVAAKERAVDAIRERNDAEANAHRSAAGLARLSTQYQTLNSSYSGLQSEIAQNRLDLQQRTAELELARTQLKEQVTAKDAMQEQLSDVYARFEKQSAEIDRLEKLKASLPGRVPFAEKAVGENEAKEILGARDLHIVDVYDVDNTGKSSRAYGRVYYVNRNVLVFYAFDLSELEKNHKAVAFQAWGFRQPQSTTTESLGLFYMDDARLNRWTLRVTDPQLLARIDTVFVTVEPPGGSHSPKGRRLLSASLAGPANHP